MADYSKLASVKPGTTKPGPAQPGDDADDILPPVTPPSGGFLLQLFLIPLIIVAIIVAVWLLFSWLAHMGGDPRDLVRKLQKGDDASWQAANTLAEMLRDPQQGHLKHDDKLAAELGEVLKKHLAEHTTTGSDAAELDKNEINLGFFLCGALGEFSTEQAAPALVEAVGEKSHPEVRREAVRALALLANNIGPEKFAQNRSALEAILAASSARGGEGDDRRRQAELRSRAAFALGVIGGDEALARLARLLDDADVNVRYNAATGLARHGDVRAIPVLVEMLNPQNDAAVADEISDDTRHWKQTSVNFNAARAAQALAEHWPKNGEASKLAELSKALDELAKSETTLPVRNAAKEAMHQIDGL